MRYIIYAICLCTILSCDSSDDDLPTITYPISLTYNSESFESPIYYEVNSEGHTQVEPNDLFQSIASLAQEEYSVEVVGVLFEKLELLTDSTGIITVAPPIEGEPSEDFEVSYVIENDQIITAIGSLSPIIFNVENEDLSELNLEICGFYYSYFNDYFQQRRTASAGSEFCSLLPATDQGKVDFVVDKEELVDMDTVVIQRMNLQYLQD